MRVVFDANVVVSGLIAPSGPPGNVLDRWLAGRFEVALSRELSDEILEVTSRSYLVAQYKRLETDVDLLLTTIDELGITTQEPLGDPRDPKDRHVLGAAVGLEADVIVSGDKDLVVLEAFEGIPILTPRQFLDRLDALDASAP